jgi:uncharacterized protein YbaR (Trm112 family)
MQAPLSELLSCPSCRSALVESAEAFVCSRCGRSYPVVEGTPRLLLETRPYQEERAPGPAGRALASVVANPLVYDCVQRLAGAHKICSRIRPLLEQTSGCVVLDVGAGTGNLEKLLPAAARYLWLDPDEHKLRGFRMKSTAPAILGDATRIPLTDSAVDWALCIGVSHHLDEAQFGTMLDELRRVVRDRLFFLDGVATPAIVSRILWRYDRGRHPRTAELLRKEIGRRFEVVVDEEFTVLHRYVLLVAR